jgi:hypothetical protein
VQRWMTALLLAGALTGGCGRAPAPQNDAPTPNTVAPEDGTPSDEARGPAAFEEPAAAAAANPSGTPMRPTAPDLADAAPPRTAPSPPTATFREVTLPAGTTLRLVLESALASDSSEVEDRVRATLSRAVSAEGSQVLPEGAEVLGVVTEVRRSGRVQGRAHLAFHFTSLEHEGERHRIRTSTVSRTAEATKGEDATKIAIGAGAGAALGAALGGGSGAAKGAAVGGAGGTGVVLATKGKEVRLGPGTAVTVTMAAPLVLRVPVP